MSISRTAIVQLLREYDEKQLAAQRDCRLRTQKIEQEIPEIMNINSQIAELSVSLAVKRIKGQSADMAEYEKQKAELLERKNWLLESRGYSLYDLQPHYECEACQDTGYVNGEKCACLKSRIIEVLYDQSNIKDILQRENFKTYTLNYYSNVPLNNGSGASPKSIARDAAIKAHNFVETFENNSDNLLISGNTGTGKTFLCNCIAKAVLDKGYNVIYLSAVKLFGILAEGTFNYKRDEENLADDLYTCDLLIIDDLGTEYTNSFVSSSFFNCINERQLRKKHTIISTNLDSEQIRDNYSERVFSRIAEKYTSIKLVGEDIRVLKKLEG